MENTKDIEFIDGLFVKAPHENSPDFIKASISIKRADLGNWLRGKEDEWINIVVKESKGGKWYCSVDNWKPEKQEGVVSTAVVSDAPNDDIPF